MSDGGNWMLLMMGPAGATGLYWYLYRYYRNTDKSHSFESETTVQAKPITGSDAKVDEIEGTQRSRIEGDNVSDYRKRVKRVQSDSG